MTGRTLEEIELGYSEVLDFHPDERKFKESVFSHLLAIAQGQREEIARLKANASTAAFDKVNDQLREANRENEDLRGLLGSAGQADIERQYRNCNP